MAPPSVGAMEIATRAPEEARAEDSEAEPFVGEEEASEFIPQDAVDAVKAVHTGLRAGTIDLRGALVRVGNTWRIVTRRVRKEGAYVYSLTQPGAPSGKTWAAEALADELTAVLIAFKTTPRSGASARFYARPTGIEEKTGKVKFDHCASSNDDSISSRVSSIDTFIETHPQLHRPPHAPVVTTADGAPPVTLDATSFPLVSAFAKKARLVVGDDPDSTLIDSAKFAAAAAAANIDIAVLPGSGDGQLDMFEKALQHLNSPALASFKDAAQDDGPPEDFGKALASIYNLPQAVSASDDSSTRAGAGEREEAQRHAGGQEDARGGQPRPSRGTTFLGRGGSPPPGRSLFDLGSSLLRGGEEPAPQRRRTEPQHRLGLTRFFPRRTRRRRSALTWPSGCASWRRPCSKARPAFITCPSRRSSTCSVSSSQTVRSRARDYP